MRINLLAKIKTLFSQFRDISIRLQKLQQAVGRIETRQIISQNLREFNNNEFQVYSQWGEDGLIQYLIHNIAIEKPIFVEFGVETYQESNTRFLLINNNWSGLVLDGSKSNIEYIKNDPIYWKHNLKAECAFINRDNINSLIKENGISGDIGLLSIDIDGNDYWVWEAIDVINPRIVVCEYNSLFGDDKTVSVPYDSSFFRTKAHYSNLYWGASITALTELANSKGYALVGSNIAGNNLFFVRRDVINEVLEVSIEEAYKVAQFRDSRDKSGKLNIISHTDKLLVIQDMKLLNLQDNKQYYIRDLYG